MSDQLPQSTIELGLQRIYAIRQALRDGNHPTNPKATYRRSLEERWLRDKLERER